MKLKSNLTDQLSKADKLFKNEAISEFGIPIYNPESHYLELAKSKYYWALLTFRHCLKASSDQYFSVDVGATNIDLFMMTPSVSSPMGPGSDSEAIPIKFGDLTTFLVDSSQFGFEPLLINNFDKVYCYLPSMRGEDHDKRHLNQFYHCEAEIRGELSDLIPIVEKYIKILTETLKALPNLTEKISANMSTTDSVIEAIMSAEKFPMITFDEAVALLVENRHQSLVNNTEHGRDITSYGEIILSKILGLKTPFWVYGYDRGRVAFYQKPDPNNLDKVINADLIFPPLFEGAFGGEIVGCGQRQDNKSEILESLRIQNISSEPYGWYINLRELPEYKTTSGFGLGIERFITWVLGHDDIRNSIPYPRLKNVLTLP